MKRFGFFLSVLATLTACSRVQPPGTDAAYSLEPQKLGTTADDRGKELAFVPRIGAIYAAGITKGSLDFSNRGGFDIYLKRYDRDKTVVWSRQIASSADDIVKDIAADASGQLYVGGRQGNLCFHSKYRADGLLLWKHTYSFCSDMAMAVDEVGNLFLAEDAELESLPVYEMRKYNSRSVQVYSVIISNYNGLGTRGIKDITTDNRGNAYVYAIDYDDLDMPYIQKVSPTGDVSDANMFAMPFTSYGDLGGYVFDHLYSGIEVIGNALYAVGDKSYYNGTNDIFDHVFESDISVVKYTLDGAISWQRTFGTKTFDKGTTITADTAGNVYAVGVTRGSLGEENAGADDILMRKLSASGSTLWTKQFGNASYDQANDIAAYSSGELYLTGTTSGALEGGTYHGRKDAFLLRRNGGGDKVWTDQ